MKGAPHLDKDRALLAVDGLTVNYGHVRALTDVSLHIAPSEAVALIGANGAGKSTLFRAVVGAIGSSDGRIVFAGEDIGSLRTESRIRRGIGYSPEGRRIFPGLTVLENLSVAAIGDAAQRSRHLDYAFELFPALGERQMTPGWQLSGGQQQMLAIARALMGRPSLLLLDEPSLGLSPKLADDVFRRMRSIMDRGTAILLAEQNVSRALQYCNRAYVLEVGRIVLSGPSEALRNAEAVRKAYLGG